VNYGFDLKKGERIKTDNLKAEGQGMLLEQGQEAEG